MNQPQPKAFSVGVVETDVFGVLAWHAKCLVPGCGWEGKRRETLAVAQLNAKGHGSWHALKGE